MMNKDNTTLVDPPSAGQTGSNLVDIEKLQKDLQPKTDQTYDWSYENGRRYASTKMGNYYMPNDEPEIHRLNEQHLILTQLKGGVLHQAPLFNKTNMKILDVGCGSGIWCLDMAETYPTAHVFGMDVSPIQPEKKPTNVEWHTHDLEHEWPFPEAYFDFIHLSLVHGCVADWHETVVRMKKHLAPGGWIEHQEFSLCGQYEVDHEDNPIPTSDNLDELRPFFRWCRLMEKAGEIRGRPLQLGPRLSEFQRAAGLQDVTEVVTPHKWGTWSSDDTENMLGARTMLSAMSGMEGFTIAIFTKTLGWTLEDTKTFIEEIKRDMRDDNIRKVMDLHVVYGQKPDEKTGSQRTDKEGVVQGQNEENSTQKLDVEMSMPTIDQGKNVQEVDEEKKMQKNGKGKNAVKTDEQKDVPKSNEKRDTTLATLEDPETAASKYSDATIGGALLVCAALATFIAWRNMRTRTPAR